MPHSYGYRARTRHTFARGFRQHGQVKLSTYMHVYRIGDYVDIKANGAVHKGMPHKYYHGKTGVIFNVSKSAVGVIINKKVGNHYMEKRINVRIEHVSPSKCRAEFLQRVRRNAAIASRKSGSDNKDKLKPIKRTPKLPNTAHIVSTKNNKPILITPIPYESLL